MPPRGVRLTPLVAALVDCCASRTRNEFKRRSLCAELSKLQAAVPSRATAPQEYMLRELSRAEERAFSAERQLQEANTLCARQKAQLRNNETKLALMQKDLQVWADSSLQLPHCTSWESGV